MKDVYITKDLGIASMLLATGHEMFGISWKEKVAFFSFSNNSDCDRLAKLFLFGEVMVNARSYHEAEKLLKGQIMEKRGEKYV